MAEYLGYQDPSTKALILKQEPEPGAHSRRPKSSPGVTWFSVSKDVKEIKRSSADDSASACHLARSRIRMGHDGCLVLHCSQKPSTAAAGEMGQSDGNHPKYTVSAGGQGCVMNQHLYEAAIC